jgi:hypothetical protein
VTLHVFSEGRNTETGWLGHLQRRARDANLSIESAGGVGVPQTVVERAIEKRRELNGRMRREVAYAHDEVWVVVDRDDHELANSLNDAADAGVGLVFSNACFELWPLLHLDDLRAHQDRAWLQSRLKELHPHYDHQRGARVEWSDLQTLDVKATSRAIALHFQSPDETTFMGGKGEPGRPRGALGNPTTTAWILHRRCLEFPSGPARLLDLGCWRDDGCFGEVLGTLGHLVAIPARAPAVSSAREAQAHQNAGKATASGG